MDIKVYHTLHKDAVKIRKEVFMEEQGFHDEFDETDETAIHLVLYIDQVPAATCRFFPGQTQGERGNHLGSRILSAAESEIRNSGGNTVRLHAQQQARPFYEKQGYTIFGEPDFDEDCPHIWMEKSLIKIY